MLLIVDSELLNALWLWPECPPRKALTPYFGAGINSYEGYQVAMTENNRKHSSKWLKQSRTEFSHVTSNAQVGHILQIS